MMAGFYASAVLHCFHHTAEGQHMPGALLPSGELNSEGGVLTGIRPGNDAIERPIRPGLHANHMP